MSGLPRTWIIVAGVLCFALLGVLPASAQLVATYNFDDGTNQGWTAYLPAAASTDAARSGSYSLKTTTNADGTGGPGINLSLTNLQPGAQYSITGYLMLAGGEAATNANLTMKSVDSSGTHYDYIQNYQVPVSSSGWTQLGGSYTVSATATSLMLYAQLVGASAAAHTFYLDDVTITMTAPPPSGNTIAAYNFEDGSLDGWSPFGSVTLTNVTPPVPSSMGSLHSLLASGRTAGYMGPSINLLGISGIVAGATYSISANVLLADADSSNPTATLSTKLTNCAGTTYNNLATSGALSNTAWTRVQGTLHFTDFPGAPASLELYIQSSSATDSFYIDDVVISETAPPPPDPSQQDNTGISSTFEDGLPDGWTGRGSATATASTAQAHGGTESLYVTGRTANWNGAQISVADKMYAGSQYAVSLWIMLEPTDGSSHYVNVSLQVTSGGTTSYPGVNGYPGTTVVADGAWHQILVPSYTMASPYDGTQAYLYVQTAGSATDLVSFYIDDFQLSYIPPPTIQTGIPSIFETLEDYFPVGAAVDTSTLQGPHGQLLSKHFNSLTSGNDMKWSSVENSPGVFTFGNADSEIGYAVCHNMLVRGHNLVWANGSQTPSWVGGDGTNSAANQAVVIENIRNHIKNVVQHFGTKVYAWDVVNEPIDATQSDCLKRGPFYNVLGKSYIDIAFEAAREFAPPGTKLFVNDYSTADPDRLACLAQLVEDLKSRGIPIDGVGHQMHNAINYPPVGAMVNAIDTIANLHLGLEQQITEMDMSIYNAGDNTSNYGVNPGFVPPAVLAQQGYLYAQYFDAFRQLRDKLTNVTFWGLADDNTWLSNFPVSRLEAPLPFDTGLQAKPAYWGIVDPSKLPGAGLGFRLISKFGPTPRRVWTVKATNPGPGVSYTTQIEGFSLTQVAGPPAHCHPVVTPPSSFPVVLGDMAEGSSAAASFTIDFRGCPAVARFTLTMPWSAANGAHPGKLVAAEQTR
jgi:endo-1,4-beta-xylanase